mmetsp:Transcript_38682/g.114929  ORF Transcript_38682/g.114929 Transcript_38682/m.114929 type:complete len:311 (+) Transcript_38682:2015-2947(+)
MSHIGVRSDGARSSASAIACCTAARANSVRVGSGSASICSRSCDSPHEDVHALRHALKSVALAASECSRRSADVATGSLVNSTSCTVDCADVSSAARHGGSDDSRVPSEASTVARLTAQRCISDTCMPSDTNTSSLGRRRNRFGSSAAAASASAVDSRCAADAPGRAAAAAASAAATSAASKRFWAPTDCGATLALAACIASRSAGRGPGALEAALPLPPLPPLCGSPMPARTGGLDAGSCSHTLCASHGLNAALVAGRIMQRNTAEYSCAVKSPGSCGVTACIFASAAARPARVASHHTCQSSNTPASA